MAQLKSEKPPQKWKKLLSEFQHTSDRVAVITGSTYLQTHLGKLLGCFFIDQAETKENLLGAEKPLATFGARIEACYALGLISSNEYHDLKIVLKIRSRFLEEADGINFSDEDIRGKCRALKIPREISVPGEITIPRRLFVLVTAMLAQQLVLRTAQAEQQRRSSPDNFMLIDVER